MSDGITLNWETMLKVGTPLIALIAGYMSLQGSVHSLEKEVAAIQIKVEGMSQTKERTMVLETKFDNLLSRLEKIDNSLQTLALTYGRRPELPSRRQ